MANSMCQGMVASSGVSKFKAQREWELAGVIQMLRARQALRSTCLRIVFIRLTFINPGLEVSMSASNPALCGCNVDFATSYDGYILKYFYQVFSDLAYLFHFYEQSIVQLRLCKSNIFITL